MDTNFTQEWLDIVPRCYVCIELMKIWTPHFSSKMTDLAHCAGFLSKLSITLLFWWIQPCLFKKSCPLCKFFSWVPSKKVFPGEQKKERSLLLNPTHSQKVSIMHFFCFPKIDTIHTSENVWFLQFFCQPIRSQKGWSFRCSLQTKTIQVVLRRL